MFLTFILKKLTFAYIISIISVFLITIADIRKRLIPDICLWPLMLAGLYIFGNNGGHILAMILGYATAFLLMCAAYGISGKEALGFGDVKLLAVAGLWLGINGLSLAVIYACAVGIMYGLVKRQRVVPFAPFLFAGVGIYYLTTVY